MPLCKYFLSCLISTMLIWNWLTQVKVTLLHTHTALYILALLLGWMMSSCVCSFKTYQWASNSYLSPVLLSGPVWRMFCFSAVSSSAEASFASHLNLHCWNWLIWCSLLPLPVDTLHQGRKEQTNGITVSQIHHQPGLKFSHPIVYSSYQIQGKPPAITLTDLFKVNNMRIPNDSNDICVHSVRFEYCIC